jgi:hypothetical protein
MRVLITGDREWGNYRVYGHATAQRQVNRLKAILKNLYDVAPDTILVEGDARGADKIAGAYWKELAGEKQVEEHPANWPKYKKSAGPIRNRFMVAESQRRAELDGHHLTCAVAFHPNLDKSKGTKDMVDVLDYHCIPVLKIK